ncbi:MAG: methyltransferase domain-containing protein [Cyclobacteriaceae bacterium]|nr:methyltransferase domain-containing protein [Cyclobacteriaceae bacterium]MDH5248676.1 methyltransferase domain-containing protein [Cyclobacteriaceae bacterium]
MAAPFDHIATSMDTVFAPSVIGQLHRKRVWRYMEEITPQLNGMDILELNCGSGEDAALFGHKGFNILATDVSEEMLKVTAQKENRFSMLGKVSSQYLDPDSFDETVFDKKFDLIFSNFGGLNSIDKPSLQVLLSKIPSILTPGGRFIGVAMSRFCMWETVYLLLKFRFKKAFQRVICKAFVQDGQGTPLTTWLYNPSQIEKWSGTKFNLIRKIPIGFALPPAHLEKNFIKRKRLLLRLHQWSKTVERLSFLSGMADYYLIDLQLK